MPNRTVGQPYLDDRTVEKSMFELMSIKRWQHMVEFIDAWAPYGLPRYSGGGVLWEHPALKRAGKRSLPGSVSQARKKFALKNADDLQPIVARYEEQLNLTRAIGAPSNNSGIFDAISDEFDMKLKAVDERIDQSSLVLGIEELLAQRDMLVLACRLYRGFLQGDYSDELFAHANLHRRRDHRVQVSFHCGALYENSWIQDRYYERTLGGNPTAFLMGNMPVWEALDLEVDLSTETARKSFFVICPESITGGMDAMRFAAGVFASALINENTSDSGAEDGGSYMARDLRKVTNSGLIWQIWNHLGAMMDKRLPIGECAHCHIPIPAGSKQTYCSNSCKTAAYEKRKGATANKGRD